MKSRLIVPDGAAIVVILALAAVVITVALITNPFEVGVNKFRMNALMDKGNI